MVLVSNLVWQCDVQAPVDCRDFEDGLAQQQWPQLQGAAAHQQRPACTHKHRQRCAEHTPGQVAAIRLAPYVLLPLPMLLT